MAKRKYKRRSKKRPSLIPKIALWILLVFQTFWLGAFIWSARSPIPPNLRQWARDRQQEQNDNDRVEDLLQQHGSRGPASAP